MSVPRPLRLALHAAVEIATFLAVLAAIGVFALVGSVLGQVIFLGPNP